MNWRTVREIVVEKSPESASQLIRSLQQDVLQLDIKTLLMKLNVSMKESDLGAPDAILQIYNDKPIIWINSKATDDIKLYAIAHELGHLFLHDISYQNDVVYKDIGFWNSFYLERQADRFAMNLLIPLNLLDNLISKGMKSSEDLSKEFGVSTFIMKNRFKLLF